MNSAPDLVLLIAGTVIFVVLASFAAEASALVLLVLVNLANKAFTWTNREFSRGQWAQAAGAPITSNPYLDKPGLVADFRRKAWNDGYRTSARDRATAAG